MDFVLCEESKSTLHPYVHLRYCALNLGSARKIPAHWLLLPSQTREEDDAALWVISFRE